MQYLYSTHETGPFKKLFQLFVYNLTCTLSVVKRQLFSLDNVTQCKHAKFGHIGVQAVDPNVENGQVGVTRVIDEMGNVAIISSIDGINIFIPTIEIQVKQVSSSLGI